MVKADWGAKHLCTACGARFYDLKRDPIVCPKCETIREPESPKPRRPARPDPKSRAAARAPAAAAVPGAVIVPDADDESIKEKADTDGADAKDADDTAAEEGDELIEDTSELGDDEVTKVVDGIGGGGNDQG